MHEQQRRLARVAELDVVELATVDLDELLVRREVERVPAGLVDRPGTARRPSTVSDRLRREDFGNCVSVQRCLLHGGNFTRNDVNGRGRLNEFGRRFAAPHAGLCSMGEPAFHRHGPDCGPERAAKGCRSASRRAVADPRWRWFGQDPRADAPHRPPGADRRRAAGEHPRDHLHQQGRQRDARARRKAGRRPRERDVADHLPLCLRADPARRGRAPRLHPRLHDLRLRRIRSGLCASAWTRARSTTSASRRA